MKRYAGILFLSVYMISFAEMHQLMRIPFLISHFVQHQSENPALSFKDFLVMHYLGPVEITDDFQQDQQLPFRSAACHVNNFSLCAYQPYVFSFPEPEIFTNEYFDFDEVSKSLFAGYDIFQPPRTALRFWI